MINNAILTDRLFWVLHSVAKQVSAHGGCRICQDASAIYAKKLLLEGSSGASAIFLAVTLGKKMSNEMLENKIAFNRRMTLEA